MLQQQHCQEHSFKQQITYSKQNIKYMDVNLVITCTLTWLYDSVYYSK